MTSHKHDIDPDMPEQGNYFGRFAKAVAWASGSPWAFLLACLTIVVWIVTGPLFDFSDTWQLVINTGTTIVTFLMVFVIQHTQNKDTVAIQLKLDELIRATEGAHNVLMDLEELSDKELQKIRCRYLALAAEARKNLREGKKDTHKPEVKETFDLARKPRDQA
jgi:low affinity Fe/Cu permease